MDIWPLLQEWEQDLPVSNKETIRSKLSQYLNNLLLHDFAALVQLLYRVDVPEAKVKAVLQQNPGVDAGDLLADLLIQRQQEKKAAFRPSKNPPEDLNEERW
jgi:hypothetical protein